MISILIPILTLKHFQKIPKHSENYNHLTDVVSILGNSFSQGKSFILNEKGEENNFSWNYIFEMIALILKRSNNDFEKLNCVRFLQALVQHKFKYKLVKFF